MIGAEKVRISECCVCLLFMFTFIAPAVADDSSGAPTPTAAQFSQKSPALSGYKPPQPRVSIEPFLESVVGVSTVTVRSKNGLVHQLREGDTLDFGDTFLTGPDAVIRVAFDQGTQVLIASKSQATVDEWKEEWSHDSASRDSNLSTPSVFQLDQGEAHFLVLSKSDHLAAGVAASPYKFYVKSKGSIIGVRGTDFVVSVEADTVVVHTLRGIVDFAESEDSLKAGNLRSIAAGTLARFHILDRKLDIAETYNANSFLWEFHQRNPNLQPLYQIAARDARSNRLNEKFRKIRELKMGILGIKPKRQ